MHESSETLRWQLDPLSHLDEDRWRILDAENERLCGGHPLLDSRFVRPLLQYFPDEVIFAQGFSADQRVAVLLLVRESAWKIAGYRPDQSQLALAVVDPQYRLEPGALCGLVNGRALRLDLSAIDPKYQQGLVEHPPGSVYSVRATNIVIKTDADFDAYWLARPKKMRKNVERYIRNLERDGLGYELRVTSDADAIDLAVARYGMLESRGWKGRTGTALHPGNAQGRFYSDVVTDFARAGHGLVMELTIGGEVVASRLLISNDSIVIALKTTYDEAYSGYGIGRILLYEMARYFFQQRPGVEIDFYTDATKDQRDWATAERAIETASFYRSPLACRLVETALQAKRELVAVLKREKGT